MDIQKIKSLSLFEMADEYVNDDNGKVAGLVSVMHRPEILGSRFDPFVPTWSVTKVGIKGVHHVLTYSVEDAYQKCVEMIASFK